MYRKTKLNPAVQAVGGLHPDGLVPLLLIPHNVSIYCIMLGNLHEFTPRKAYGGKDFSDRNGLCFKPLH